jgi:hypothetical protein
MIYGNIYEIGEKCANLYVTTDLTARLGISSSFSDDLNMRIENENSEKIL